MVHTSNVGETREDDLLLEWSCFGLCLGWDLCWNPPCFLLIFSQAGPLAHKDQGIAIGKNDRPRESKRLEYVARWTLNGNS